MHQGSRPLRLPEIVSDLHPWLQSRISAIRIQPVPRGGWEAILTYVARTLPPPPDLAISPAQAVEPPETRHAVALPSVGTEAELRAQLRELAGIAELGTLQVERQAPVTAGAQVWHVTTHAGLIHQRRAWLSRIGRPDLHR